MGAVFADNHRPDADPPGAPIADTHPAASAAGRPESASATVRESDAALVELLRTEESPGVGDLAEALGVTATAVRQRLDRLMRDGIVARDLVGPGTGGGTGNRPRGRPAFGYRLTEKGRRTGGDNFRDLAMVLWREVRGVGAPEVRRGLVSRIGSAMARLYRDRVTGATVSDRLDEAAQIMQQRQIACAIEPADLASGKPAVLTTHVCPYPELAEGDRGICAAERLMLQELVGAQVTLDSCRLDGAECCRFTVTPGGAAPLGTIAPATADSPAEARSASTSTVKNTPPGRSRGASQRRSVTPP